MVQKAKEQGDFVLVGLHTDEDVSERRGLHLPIMDLHERCLSVLACKYVDEAIIGTHTHARMHADFQAACRRRIRYVLMLSHASPSLDMAF